MANYQWFAKAHAAVYHHSRGWLGAKMGPFPMVLMDTIGAKSGQLRRAPVVCYPLDDQGVLVHASNDGLPRPPAWYFNLKAHPEIMIRLGRRRFKIRAEELDEGERAAVWPTLVARNPRLSGYAERAGRVIPVLRLRPID